MLPAKLSSSASTGQARQRHQDISEQHGLGRLTSKMLLKGILQSLRMTDRHNGHSGQDTLIDQHSFSEPEPRIRQRSDAIGRS